MYSNTCTAFPNICRDHIFALGGFNGISRMNTGEKYNPIKDSWTSVPEMTSPRSNFAIEVSFFFRCWIEAPHLSHYQNFVSNPVVSQLLIFHTERQIKKPILVYFKLI